MKAQRLFVSVKPSVVCLNACTIYYFASLLKSPPANRRGQHAMPPVTDLLWIAPRDFEVWPLRFFISSHIASLVGENPGRTRPRLACFVPLRKDAATYRH
jgi:hypothetical protein